MLLNCVVMYVFLVLSEPHNDDQTKYENIGENIKIC